ncbi:MAG: PhzF family phenazine biosynthesis protein [Schwartzia sp.]|nr:PhzF family phenazine biosynthesis protein [Schwartzia sp. (in: firmicutes)]
MKYFMVDAFTDRVFGGGPAGIAVVGRWPADAVMREIARETNLPATIFLQARADRDYDLRAFLPGGEVPLCGHGTLAAAFCLFRFLDPGREKAAFHTKRGLIPVTKEAGGWISLTMPAIPVQPVENTPAMVEALDIEPAGAYFGEQYLFLFEREEEVAALTPDFAALAALPEGQGAFVAAPAAASGYDIVCRAFWPKLGVNEDPVCGVMHCHLFPLWATRMGKADLVSRQLSPRGATVRGSVQGANVVLRGQAALFQKGEIFAGE